MDRQCIAQVSPMFATNDNDNDVVNVDYFKELVAKMDCASSTKYRCYQRGISKENRLAICQGFDQGLFRMSSSLPSPLDTTRATTTTLQEESFSSSAHDMSMSSFCSSCSRMAASETKNDDEEDTKMTIMMMKDTSVHASEEHPPRKRLRVTFAQSIVTKEGSQENEHNDKNQELLWYTNEEYTRIHEENLETVRLIQNGLSHLLFSLGYCKRGLESYVVNASSSSSGATSSSLSSSSSSPSTCFVKSRTEIVNGILDKQVDLWSKSNSVRKNKDNNNKSSLSSSSSSSSFHMNKKDDYSSEQEHEHDPELDDSLILAELYAMETSHHAFRAFVIGLHDWSSVKPETESLHYVQEISQILENLYK